MLKTPITFCNFFFIWFTSFQRKCNQKQKKDNSIQIVNSPFLVKIKRSKLVIFKLPLSRSTIKRILNRLQQQEIVIRTGSNRNGYWTVRGCNG